MIVNHAHRLHEGINYCGAAKLEPLLLKIIGNLLGSISPCRHVRMCHVFVLQRHAPYEIPKIGVETFSHFDGLSDTRVGDRRFDFTAMPNNTGVFQ